MTKRELIEALRNVPDDAVVWFSDSEDGMTEVGGVRPSPLYRHRTGDEEYYSVRALPCYSVTQVIGEHRGVELTR